MAAMSSGERMFGAGTPTLFGFADATGVTAPGLPLGPWPSSANAGAAGRTLIAAAANTDIALLKRLCIVLFSLSIQTRDAPVGALVCAECDKETFGSAGGTWSASNLIRLGSCTGSVLAVCERRVNSGGFPKTRVQSPFHDDSASSQAEAARLLCVGIRNDDWRWLAGPDGRLARTRRSFWSHASVRHRGRASAPRRLRLRRVGQALAGRRGRSCLHRRSVSSHRQLLHRMDHAARVFHRVPVGSSRRWQTCWIPDPVSRFDRALSHRRPASVFAAPAARHFVDVVPWRAQLPWHPRQCHVSGLGHDHRSRLVRNRCVWKRDSRIGYKHASRLFCGAPRLDITRVADRALLYDGIRIRSESGGGSAQGISFARILSRDCAGAFCWLCILCGRDCGRFFCGAMAKLVGKTIRHCRRIWTGYGNAMAGAPYPDRGDVRSFPVFQRKFRRGEPLVVFFRKTRHDSYALRQNSSPVSDAVDGDYRRNDCHARRAVPWRCASCSRDGGRLDGFRMWLARSEFIALPDRVSLTRPICRGARCVGRTATYRHEARPQIPGPFHTPGVDCARCMAFTRRSDALESPYTHKKNFLNAHVYFLRDHH